MFALYLAGFLLYRSWWYQCQNGVDNSSPVSVGSIAMHYVAIEGCVFTVSCYFLAHLSFSRRWAVCSVAFLKRFLSDQLSQHLLD